MKIVEVCNQIYLEDGNSRFIIWFSAACLIVVAFFGYALFVIGGLLSSLYAANSLDDTIEAEPVACVQMLQATG